MSEATVLSIDELQLEFPVYGGSIKALNRVSLQVKASDGP